MAVTAKQIEEVVAEGDDPVEAARAAGLRHVSDARPGITRKRSGKGFTYAGPDGRTIRDEAEIRRIRALAVPPAWTKVWICPDPRGHIQAKLSRKPHIRIHADTLPSPLPTGKAPSFSPKHLVPVPGLWHC